LFSKRRSELQIIGEILDISKDGAKKTEILYQNNMSFSQLQNYLSFLLKKEILKENTVRNSNGITSTVFVTTEKGHELLGDIQKILTYFE
jgi:predicted transcriptional regulator